MKRATYLVVVLLAIAALTRADDPKPDPGPTTVYTYGARGDGQADDRDAIARACAAGGVVVFPRGTYRVSRSVPITAPNGLTLRGEGGATIVYPSDDATVKADGVALLDSHARSAFYLLDCKGVRIEGLNFRGGPSDDITVNIGPAVYARSSEDVHLRDCRVDAGGGLFNQDPTPTDVGARLTDCVSYGTHNVTTVGSDAVISGCRFELPATKDYDRFDGTHASTHGVYVFAGRRNVVVRGCTFRNIRTSAVKFSGSSEPIRGAIVSGNVFDDCGNGVHFGSANPQPQEHSGCVITGNLFRDCTTNRLGWTHNAAVQIAGSRGVVISGNNFDYTRASQYTIGGCWAIVAAPGNNAALEDLTIANNSFTATAAISQGGVLVTAIEVRDAGKFNPYGGNVTITGNTIGAVAGQGIVASGNQGLSLRGNTFRGPIVAMVLDGNPGAVASGNVLIRTTTTSHDAPQLKVTGDPPMVCESIGSWTYAGVKPVDGGSGPAGPPGKDGKDATPALPRIRTVQTVTIPSGKTSVVVEHGLRGQPAPEDIGFIPDGPGPIWVSKITPTSLTVQIATPAPVGGRKFMVSASRQP